jgi:prenyltransferase beta subunit
MKRLILLSLAVLIGSAPIRAQTPEEKKATVAYLQSLQDPGDGFRNFARKPGVASVAPTIQATSAALRALKYFGGEPRDRKGCSLFVRRCYDQKRGGFGEVPGKEPNVVTTAVGIMAVVAMQLPTQYYLDAVVKYLGENAKTFEEIRMAAAGFEAIHQRPVQADQWLKELTKLRNGDGSYGQGDGAAVLTGGAVAAVLRLGSQVEGRAQALKVIKDGQRPDGGFGKAGAKGSDLGSSYRIMRALFMLKEKPADVEAFRRFVAKCRNADGGYSVAPGEPSSASGTYYAASILHWLE